MRSNVQQRIVELRNELKAQKVSSGLTYPSLLLPENTPSLTYSDTASLSGSGTTPVARVRFRFERNDGMIDAPLINFAFTASFTPTYAQFAINQGFTITGDDLGSYDFMVVSGYIGEVGDGYVDFYVDFGNELRDDFFNLNSISFSTTCQAISNVYGTFTVERVI